MTQSEESVTRMMLTAFLATGIDSSHSLRMTINVFLIMTADPLLAIRMTSYLPSHHDSRSFNHALDDDFPSAVILNGGKNALWEKRETE